MDKAKSPVKVKPEVKTELSYLHGLKDLPIYDQPGKLLTTPEAIRVLLFSGLSDRSICPRVPISVDVNSVFIVDLNKLSSPNDITCDDMGAWTWGGSNKRWVSVEEDGFLSFLKKKAEVNPVESCYRVWKRYYSLKCSPDIKKMILVLEDHVSDTLNLAILQYYFSQGGHKLIVAPHGNSRAHQPYMRTMPSMLTRVKEQAQKSTPKRDLQFVSAQAGGILEATSSGAMPRNRQQVKDARQKSRGTDDFDPLFSVMHMCKEGEGKGSSKFIRMVNAAPYPMMVISFDYTLDDLVRFCTYPENFSILIVDPTFNLGEFDVTVTTL